MLFPRNWKIVAALGAMAVTAYAGGFFLTIHAPGETKDAVLVVEAQGCGDYSQAKITGVAEGLVHGQRQSIPVELTPTAKPGLYAVRQQWPANGKWVLVLSGTTGDRHTHTIVELGPDGRMLPDSAPSKGIRMAMHPVTAAEIQEALERHS